MKNLVAFLTSYLRNNQFLSCSLINFWHFETSFVYRISYFLSFSIVWLEAGSIKVLLGLLYLYALNKTRTQWFERSSFWNLFINAASKKNNTKTITLRTYHKALFWVLSVHFVHEWFLPVCSESTWLKFTDDTDFSSAFSVRNFANT